MAKTSVTIVKSFIVHAPMVAGTFERLKQHFSHLKATPQTRKLSLQSLQTECKTIFLHFYLVKNVVTLATGVASHKSQVLRHMSNVTSMGHKSHGTSHK